ncbi:DUF4234 domain-containing protein [Anaerobium acetethylicum]|uniref:DUF4234 domain-containing protein n=1 Tax=Anaerobium acetethylicum TaxID=1619234 RepID=A0A1D3TQX7_9FIRM|nr:DUF4234 domain-containing protein [Anaerobium acetethylicum]SCP96037.1 protein of unknown function [Anaerobium acetethylicum]
MNFTKREPVVVLLLSIITCGIYYYYWVYQVTKELGMYLQNDNNPVLDLLLSLFCAPYGIYWMYKMAKQIAEAQNKAGKFAPVDNSVLYVILGIFGLWVVTALIMQSTINEIEA